MKQRVRAVLFDCDGVLVDTEPLANRMLSAVFAEHGVVMSDAECRAMFTGLNPRGVGERLLEATGLDLRKALVEQASGAFMRAIAREGLSPLEGVVEVLGMLRDGGVRMATASNSPLEELVFKLRLSGLERWFAPHHYSGDALGRPKPEPAVYEHAARELGVEAGACVVIEDSVVGVRAGAAAGMRVWGFVGTHAGEPGVAAHGNMLMQAGAERVIEQMHEVQEVVNGIAMDG